MIAIPGDMPKCCEDCRFCGPFWFCELLEIDLNPVEGWNQWNEQRHPDCPLRNVKVEKTIWRS